MSEASAGIEGLPRLASFAGHLLLDGHGHVAVTSEERRDMHPYFGTWPYNVGDQFVSLAIARLLRFEEFYSIQPGASDADFERVNRDCDVFLIRGSNFIYPGFFATHMPLTLLRKIRIPIVYIGAGIQFKLGEHPRLTRDDIEVLKYIHASSASCSVRGFRAAELLHEAGIDNVRPLGCPTMLWSLDPELKVKPATWDHVGWTVTDMTGKPEPSARQFAVMEELRRRAARFTAFVQGGEVVIQEYILCRDGEVTEQRADEELSPALLHSTRAVKSPEKLAKTVRYYYRGAPEPLVESLLESAFFSNRVGDYLRKMRELSLVCGTRLHGNTMALCQGVPAVYAVHDERLRDMVELMQVPAFDILDRDAAIEPERLSWEPFEAAYRRIYRETAAFFAENGLPSNLVAPATSEAEAA